MPVEAPTGTTNLLIVEDNPVDVRLLQYALKQEADWRIATTVANDGEKAIDILLAGSAGTTGKTDFVVLDLNLPKRDGAEVLHAIRTHRSLRCTPVAILSSSPMDVIKGRMRRAHLTADCYFTKPMHIDEYVALGKQLRVCYGRATHGGECSHADCECKPGPPT